MHARFGITVALLWLSLTALANFCARVVPMMSPSSVQVAGDAGEVAGSTVQEPGAGTPAVLAPRPFTHIRHVPRTWVNQKEVWRDCRGCHRFDKQSLVSAPQKVCAECHRVPGLLVPEFKPDWRDDLGLHRTRTRDAFRHHTHAMLECRQCHEEKNLAERAQATPAEDFLFDDFFIRTGPGQCAHCHEEGARLPRLHFFEGAEDKTLADAMGLDRAFEPPPMETEAERRTYAKKLVEVFAGPDGGLNKTPLPTGGEFDHADHCGLTDGKLGVLLVCADCHTNIEKARPNEVGTQQIPLGKCGGCHIADAAKTPARPAPQTRPQQRRSWSLQTFAHADHFGAKPGAKPGVCSEAAYAQIEQKKCGACHIYAPDTAGSARNDFPFGASRGDGKAAPHLYAGCVECHDQPGWQTGESKDAPRHASTGGPGTGWNQCKDCHVFGGLDMAKDRPMAEVARRRERTFQFAANVHPDITAKGIVRSEQSDRRVVPECKTCHRAKVPELATRLVKRVFRHDTHLPATPTPADCASCHPSASIAPTSEQLATAGRTYDLTRCGDCHWGGEVTEADAVAAPQKTTCVEFSHGAHAAVAKLSCLECHAPAANGQDYATLEAALACKQCHDHKTGGPTREELFDGAVASCAHCHHDEAAPLLASVPALAGSPAVAADPRYSAVQSLFAGFVEAQFHPLGSTCATCHPATSAKPIERTVEDHLSATAGGVHKDERNKDGCLGCHWKPLNASWATSVGSVGTDAMNEFRAAPASVATRQKFGSLHQGYPGSEGSPR